MNGPRIGGTGDFKLISEIHHLPDCGFLSTMNETPQKLHCIHVIKSHIKGKARHTRAFFGFSPPLYILITDR